MSRTAFAGISFVAKTPRPVDVQLDRLVEYWAVTNIQPFGVSILISISGQRWSEMLGRSTKTPILAFDCTVNRVWTLLTFHAGGAIARQDPAHRPM
jgi:hypothetical protein